MLHDHTCSLHFSLLSFSKFIFTANQIQQLRRFDKCFSSTKWLDRRISSFLWTRTRRCDEHTTELCRKIRSRKQTLGLVSNTSLFMGYLPLNLRFDCFTNGNNERKCQGPNYGRFVPCFISMNIVHYFSPGKFAVFFNI